MAALRPYRELRTRLREAGVLGSVGSLLSWDQETMMPAGAAEFRAEELAMVARLAHERRIDPRVGELLEACEADPELTADPVESANLREIRRDWERARRVPSRLVAEITETGSRALEAWKRARAESDFSLFRPLLERVFALQREKAACLRSDDERELYDCLLEEYEPGVTANGISAIFEALRRELKPLIAEFASDAPGGLEQVPLPARAQAELNRRLAEWIGYDTSAGRLDESTHPFTESLGPGDTRITTRYREDDFLDALSCTMHEVGHALYEQGLPKRERLGQPLAEAASLGLHESQSRLWENQVGRSRAFWSWLLPRACEVLGGALEGVSVDRVVHAANLVRPRPIRVESDETTYNLHIMLRFDVERAVVHEQLAVADIPALWNERMKQDLGVRVERDAEGCLQDIHWSFGAVGYFPTYTLGNLYAAQLWDAARDAVSGLDRRIERGEFAALLGWLRENIHVHGRRFSAVELCERVTGKPLTHEPLIRHLRTVQQTLRRMR